MNSVNFNRAAEYYDQTRGLPPEAQQPVANAFLAAGKLTSSSQVLEIGVGTGRIAVPVSPHVGRYLGVDISRAMMRKLREKSTSVWTIEGSATALPLPDASVDGAIAVHVFHLIPDWQAALHELARVLRPGARLLHAWGDARGRNALENLRQVWDDALPPAYRGDRAGLQFRHNSTFLVNAGWQVAGEAQVTFLESAVPAQFLHAYRERMWSRLWNLPDEIHAAAMQKLEATARTHFSDLDAPIEVEGKFVVQAYLPPVQTTP